MSATNSDSMYSQDGFSLAEKYKTMVVTAREISEIYERTGAWDQAVHLLQCMLEPADKSEDKRIEAEIRILLGNLLWKRGSFDEARTVLQEAEQRAGSDSKILGDCLYYLGKLCYVEAILMRKKDHSDAHDYHMKACALREKCGDKKVVFNHFRGSALYMSTWETTIKHLNTTTKQLRQQRRSTMTRVFIAPLLTLEHSTGDRMI